jgi:Peptidase A4 family
MSATGVLRLPVRFFALVVVVTLTLFGFGAVHNQADSSTPSDAHVSFTNFVLSNWAGYIAKGTGGEFVTASAQWVEPKVKCLKKRDLYAPWVGIDGAGSQTVEQTGVQTACSSGRPVDSAWYEVYPNPPVYYDEPVSAGDAFRAAVTADDSSFTMEITDITKGWTKSTTKTEKDAKQKSAEAVIEAPGGYPQITSVNFTGVKFNGAELSTFNPQKSSSDSGSGTTVYHPGPITNGDDFSVVPRSSN